MKEIHTWKKGKTTIFLRNTFSALTLIAEYTDSVADTFDSAGLNVTMTWWMSRMASDNIVTVWLCQYFRWLSTILQWL